MGWIDPDKLLQQAMDTLIEGLRAKDALGLTDERWRPGKALKLLLAGYVGARNTGADVRVEEMIRQFRSIFPADALELTMMTLDPAKTAGYFQGARQVTIPMLFPKFLFDECPRHHGVVACEGSMFKSKFASSLTTMMAGALGLAAAEGKLSVGYGAEAGAMEPSLREFVEKHCAKALVLCRNEASRDVLQKLRIRHRPGADTAWTFEPAPPERGAALLQQAGWDGSQEILTLCPINPFWWPVRPDVVKALAWKFLGEHKKEHHSSIYFHEHSEASEQKYRGYLKSLAGAITAFRRERGVFVVLVGMEQLDRKACNDLNALLPEPVPTFISDDYNMFDLVSVLRHSSYLVSSRFHAVVTSMPAQVPSIGITMDERLRNLFVDRGTPEFLLQVDEDGLEENLLLALRRLVRESPAVAEAIGRFIPSQLRLMGQMGIDLVRETAAIYPDLPRRQVPESWEYFLPSLPPLVEALLDRYSDTEAKALVKLGGST